MVHFILQSDAAYVMVALAKTQKTCNTFNIARTMAECYTRTFTQWTVPSVQSVITFIDTNIK